MSTSYWHAYNSKSLTLFVLNWICLILDFPASNNPEKLGVVFSLFDSGSLGLSQDTEGRLSTQIPPVTETQTDLHIVLGLSYSVQVL